MCRWHHPYGRKRRGTIEPLDESERGEWKNWLKTQHSKNEDHGIWSHHFMTNREKVEAVTFYFLELQYHCGWWLQPWNLRILAPWKEIYDKHSVLRSRDITLPGKACIVKAMVFPVILYGCESVNKEGWVPKNWCLQTVVLEKTLESPLDSKIKPVNLKEINPEYSLEALMLKLKL